MIFENIDIDHTWKKVLNSQFESEYFIALKNILSEKIESGKTIYPHESLIFNAFNLTPLDKVKVVIIGQDPYHNPGQAMGLSFSVPREIRVPPSLKNVYKEIAQDTGDQIPEHGDLTGWAKQGVFLLNAMLTVEEKKPGSHKKIGWQKFTDSVISTISGKKEGVIFMLWGRYAQGKKPLIDIRKHTVLEAAHPSPMARNAFSGCKHFSTCNKILRLQGKNVINWSV